MAHFDYDDYELKTDYQVWTAKFEFPLKSKDTADYDKAVSLLNEKFKDDATFPKAEFSVISKDNSLFILADMMMKSSYTYSDNYIDDLAFGSDYIDDLEEDMYETEGNIYAYLEENGIEVDVDETAIDYENGEAEFYNNAYLYENREQIKAQAEAERIRKEKLDAAQLMWGDRTSAVTRSDYKTLTFSEAGKEGNSYLSLYESLGFDASGENVSNYSFGYINPADGFVFAGDLTRDEAAEIVSHWDDPNKAFDGKGVRSLLEGSSERFSVIDAENDPERAVQIMKENRSILAAIDLASVKERSRFTEMMYKPALKELVTLCAADGKLNYKDEFAKLSKCDSPYDIYDFVKNIRNTNEKEKCREQLEEYFEFLDCFEPRENIPICKLSTFSDEYKAVCDTLEQIKGITEFEYKYIHERVDEEDRYYFWDYYAYSAESFDSLGDYLKGINEDVYKTVVLSLNKEGNLFVQTLTENDNMYDDYNNGEYTETKAVLRANGGIPIEYKREKSSEAIDNKFRSLYENTGKIDPIALYDLINDAIDKTKAEKARPRQITDD